MEYRYMIYNNLQKEFQFPSICETTEKGANTLLFKKIGNDARKWRFEVKKIPKEEAINIRTKLKRKYKLQRLHRELPNISFVELYNLVVKNEEIQKQGDLK